MIISFKNIGAGQGGGVTTGDVQTMITSALTPYYTSAQTDSAIASATNDMATQTWVEGQGYLTEHQSLEGYTTTAYTQDLELSIAGALNLKENLSNKVTSLSSASTDTQYPSAKAVYDALPNLSDYYTSTQTDAAIASATTDMATKTWVEGKGYLTEHQSLADYYTSTQTDGAIATAVSNKVSSTSITTIWKGTQAEYDAIAVKDNNTFYIIV